MYTTSMCMFLKLKSYFAETWSLANLTYLAIDHIRWENYAATYIEN